MFRRAALAAALALAAAGCGGGGGGSAPFPSLTTVVRASTSSPSCDAAIASAIADGQDVCAITIDFALDNPLPAGSVLPDLALTVNGPAGFLFYSDPNPLNEPVASGARPRTFSATFNPTNWTAQLTLYVRSTVGQLAPNTSPLSFSSGTVVNESLGVRFQPDPNVPASLVIAASGFVAALGGTTQVTGTVLNALSAPIAGVSVAFSSDDPQGAFFPAASAATDALGVAALDFGTINTAPHAVQLTATVALISGGSLQDQITVQVFDAKSDPAAVEYAIVGCTDGSAGNCAAAAGAGASGFFGTAPATADSLAFTARVLSIDEQNNGGALCNCDAATDANVCMDAGEIACPAGGTIVQIECPAGLANPTDVNNCKFAYDAAFLTTEANCGAPPPTAGSCVRVSCPGTSPCVLDQTTTGTGNDPRWRVVSGSVTTREGPPTFLQPIVPRAKVVGGADLSVDRTDATPAIEPEATLFLPDPSLGAEAVFTKPLVADNGGVNQNCTALTDISDPTGISSIQCSNNGAFYALVKTDANRPRVPLQFEIRNVLGAPVTPTPNVTLSLNGPSGVPVYEVCRAGATGCLVVNGSGDATHNGPLADFSDPFVYPPFSDVPYSIAVSVDIPLQAGFVGAAGTLMLNPDCTSPVAISCAFGSAGGPAPAVPPACYPASQIQADGLECDFVTCEARSFAQEDPGGAATALGCAGTETVDETLWGIRLLEDADAGDPGAEVELFCDPAANCDLIGNYVADLPLQLTNAAGVKQTQTFVRVDSTALATATFTADFLARMVRDDDGNPVVFTATDTDPANLIEQVVSSVVDRDPTLPGSVVVQAVDVATGLSSATEIFTQFAADSATAPDLFNAYLTADSKFKDPFAARLKITIKDFGGADYVNANGNPLCNVQLTRNGTIGTQVTQFITPDCTNPQTSQTLAQTSGNALVEACVISNGAPSGASANASVTAQLQNCGTANATFPLPVRSVLRGVRYTYDLRNTTGATVGFTGVQSKNTLDGTVFCKPSDAACPNTAQPEAFAAVGLLTGKGAIGTLMPDESGLSAIYSESPPTGTCGNAFSLAPLASGSLWRFDVSLHPDPEGLGTLTNRLTYTSAQADAFFDNTGITFEEVIQNGGTPPACNISTLSTVVFDIQSGTPLYFGGP